MVCTAIVGIIVLGAPEVRAQEEMEKSVTTDGVRESLERDVTPEVNQPATDSVAPAQDGALATEKAKVSEEEDYIERTHRYLSRQVLSTAEWLDSFFDDPRFAAEENRTRVKVGLEYNWDRAGDKDFSIPISARLRLPKLEEKARVVLVGAPNEDPEGKQIPAATAASKIPSAQETGTTAGVDYFFRATRDLNIATRVGVRFREGEPELFVQPRYRQLWTFDPTALRFVQDFKWWTEFGWESVTTLDLERPLDDRLFFRTSLQGAWTEREKDTYYYSLSFNLRQILSPRRVLQYEWVNGFQTKTQNDLDEVRFTVRYRQKISGDWLYGEFAPYASYRKDQDFDFTPGFMIKVEMFFGQLKGLGL